MTTNKQPQKNKQNPSSPEQKRQSQRMEEGVRTGKGDINENKRNQNNPNQPR